ncbi:MAG: FtsX-like permease family protein [Thermoplasmata archaeon]
MATVADILIWTVDNIFRSKRRSFSSIIGIILAVALLSGEILALEGTQSSILKKSLKEVSVDYKIQASAPDGFLPYRDQNGVDALDILNSMREVGDVKGVEMIYELPTLLLSKKQYQYTNYSELMEVTTADILNTTTVNVVGVSHTLEGWFDTLGLHGDLSAFNPNSPSYNSSAVILPEPIAYTLDIKIGDTIWIYNVRWGDTVIYVPPPVALKVIGFFNSTINGPGFRKSSFLYSEDINETSVLYPIDDILSLESTLYYSNNLSGSSMIETQENKDKYHHFKYYCWFNRDKVIDPYDSSGSKKDIEKIQSKLRNKIAETGLYPVVLEEPLPSMIRDISDNTLTMQIVVGGISIPVIILGVYLGVVGYDLNMNERRREIGIFKSRGGGDHQVLAMLMGESAILGIFAGIFGIILGILSSQLILMILPYFKIGGYITIEAGEASLITVLKSFGIWDMFTFSLTMLLFSLLLSILAGWLAISRVYNISVSEALHIYSKKAEAIRYDPLLDIMLIFFGLFFIIFYIINDAAVGKQLLGDTGLNTCCLMGSAPFAIFTPVALIFGIARFVTLSSTNIFNFFSMATIPFTKDLYYIINKNIIRNPRRVSRICVIVSAAVAMGILVVSLTDSQTKYEHELVTAQLGSDIALDSYYDITFKNTLEKQVPGIEGVATVSWTESGYIPKAKKTGSDYYDYYIKLAILDSTTYYDLLKVDSSYFKEGDPSEAFSLLAKQPSTPDGAWNAIVATSTANNLNLGVDDTIFIELKFQNLFTSTTVRIKYKIVAVVEILPGAQFYSTARSTDFVYVDLLSIVSQNASLEKTLNYNRFIIKVKDGYNPVDVAADINSRYNTSVYRMKVYQDELENGQRSPVFSSILKFLFVQFGFMLIIIAVGLTLIMYVASIEREREMAEILARGATRSNLFSLFLGEAVTICLVGFAIGLPTGFGTAYAFNRMISNIGSSVYDPDIAIALGFSPTWRIFIIVILTFVVMIFSSILIAYKVSRINISQILRIRGG